MMIRSHAIAPIVLSSLLVLALGLPDLGAQDVESDAPRLFLIGNSLTWDTVPSKLDGRVQWHVDCGKNLAYIYEHPEEPCVKTSTLWPEALKENQFDIVCIQPHYGTTLEQDVDVIEHWLKLQPSAVFVIHTGWSRSASLDEEFLAQSADGLLQHSNVYFETLVGRLRTLHPKREFRVTEATSVLNEIASDVKSGAAPIAKIEELYRDKIHMTIQGGRYLMHNVMRKAVGQPTSAVGFEKVPKELSDYIDSKLK